MITVTSFYVKLFEIDKMNIVYHPYYARWFELGRMDFLDKAGLPNSSITTKGFYLPLSQIECRYKSPAKYGDEISVSTSIIYISCVKLKFEYKVLNRKTGKVLAAGSTVHAWTDNQLRPVNIEKAAPEIYTLLKACAEKVNNSEEKKAAF
jgi:acyl-CoA thioester hydrolase